MINLHCSKLAEFSQNECICELPQPFLTDCDHFVFSLQVLDDRGKNVTICVPDFGQDLYRDENLVTGLGTTLLIACILYSW